MKGLELEDKNIQLLYNYNGNSVNKEFEKLSKKHKDKDETILTHIIGIIEETKLNIILGAIKDRTMLYFTLLFMYYTIPVNIPIFHCFLFFP